MIGMMVRRAFDVCNAAVSLVRGLAQLTQVFAPTRSPIRAALGI
jgi:hypothetical protein